MRACPGSEHTVSKSTIPLHDSLTPAVGVPGAIFLDSQRTGGILLRGGPGDVPERGVVAAGEGGTTPAVSFCASAKPSTVTTSAVMELVGTVLYCTRFVPPLYSVRRVEVKPRSLIVTDLLSIALDN